MTTVPITRIASAKVTMMWLVTVKKPGIMPSRFAVSTNMKSEKTRGKNFIPSWPAASRKVPATKSCSDLGDRLRAARNDRALARRVEQAADNDSGGADHEQRRIGEIDRPE